MKPSDVANQLRQLAAQLIAEGKYNPFTDALLIWKSNHNHEAGPNNLIFKVQLILHDAHQRGDFNGMPAIASAIAGLNPNAGSQILVNIFELLKPFRTHLWGVDPKQGAIEKLADAFAKLQKVSGKKRTTPADEANIKARDYLEKHPKARVRDLQNHIGCSLGLAAGLPAWKAVIGARKAGRTPKPKLSRLTSKSEKVIGEDDTALDVLIKQQQEDAEPSPLDDATHVDRQRNIRSVRVYTKRG